MAENNMVQATMTIMRARGSPIGNKPGADKTGSIEARIELRASASFVLESLGDYCGDIYYSVMRNVLNHNSSDIMINALDIKVPVSGRWHSWAR
jgi:hypothetical protein